MYVCGFEYVRVLMSGLLVRGWGNVSVLVKVVLGVMCGTVCGCGVVLLS